MRQPQFRSRLARCPSSARASKGDGPASATAWPCRLRGFRWRLAPCDDGVISVRPPCASRQKRHARHRCAMRQIAGDPAQLRFDPLDAVGAPPAPSPAGPPCDHRSLFYLVAAVAVILLGLSKGGFFGLGVIALPLMSLYVPPLQAAAILVPVVLAQDVIDDLDLSKDLERLEPEGDDPRHGGGDRRRRHCSPLRFPPPHPACNRADRHRLRAALLARPRASSSWHSAQCRDRRVIGAIGGFTTLLANAGGPAWQIHLLRRTSTSSPMRARSPCCLR